MDVSSLEEEREQVKGKLQQVMGAKKKLVLMLDKLDVNDRHYERKYQDMQERLDNLYDRISELEEMLADVGKRRFPHPAVSRSPENRSINSSWNLIRYIER